LARVWSVWRGGGTALALEDEFRLVAERLLDLRRFTFNALAGRTAARPSTNLELFRRTQRARMLLDETFCSDLFLEDLARAACLSPFHFHRAFRAFYGVTPYQYQVRLRIQEAARLLERDDRPIAAICSNVGFKSVPSFTNLFRSHYGMSPGQFRSRARKTGKSKLR
jgi:AraC-like DNA-binding protein